MTIYFEEGQAVSDEMRATMEKAADIRQQQREALERYRPLTVTDRLLSTTTLPEPALSDSRQA